jgi:outer membrane protein assembly factor BamB
VYRLTLILTLVIGLTAAVHAENWPNWRGPFASGVSPERGLPTTWSTTENIAWKAQLRGLGISSPIIWGDRVFVTSQAGQGVSRRGPRLFQEGDAAAAGERPLGSGAAEGTSASGGAASFLVTAFDRASGRQLWEYELQAEGQLPSTHEKHNLASSSPVTDGERVYAWFGTGQIVALDLNGTLLWKRNLSAEYGRFDINWGHGSSPVVHGDTVILLCYHPAASYLLALDSRTGNVKWKVDRGGGFLSYSTPIVVQTQESAELVVNSGQGMSGHNASTGELLWHIDESNSFPVPSPVQNDGVIYTSRGYRSSPFMAIRPGGKGNVAASHVLWRVATGAPYVSSLIYYDGLIYFAGDVGVVTVADARTGARVWQERIGGVFTASPVAADGKVYLFSEGGETIVLAAGRIPRVLARNKLDARQLASPAISGGRLFIRSDDALFAIGR